MRGAPPKDAAHRQRRNRKPGAATLSAPTDALVPPLPMDRVWHDGVIAAWCEWWTSPMASQWLPVDRHGLVRLAILLQDYFESTDAKLRISILAELRHQASEYGFSPLARSRLHWQLAQTDRAERQLRRRDKLGGPDDPRARLGTQGTDNVVPLRGLSA